MLLRSHGGSQEGEGTLADDGTQPGPDSNRRRCFLACGPVQLAPLFVVAMVGLLVISDDPIGAVQRFRTPSAGQHRSPRDEAGRWRAVLAGHRRRTAELRNRLDQWRALVLPAPSVS
jgi:hypothetical protein